jgi:integrase
MVNGKRIREVFPTKEEAETRGAQIRAQKQREGTAAFSLNAAVRTETAKCVEKLQAYRGASLTAAVDYYIAHYLKLREAPPVRDMIARLLEEKQSSNCRPRTLQDLRSRWGKFAQVFGDRQLSEITTEEFTRWLNKVGSSPVNRHNYRRKIKELYRAAIRRKWAVENVVEATDRVLLDETTPGILTVTQAAALLKQAPAYGMLPYCVLGLFCGIRSDELQKLRWENIQFTGRTVTIDSKIAKKRRQRLVPLNGTAASWLAHCVQRAGPIVDPVNFRKSFDAWRKAAGITRWPDNALRHSFGSYHLAHYGDEVKTAMIMGHRATEVLHRHYKALCTAGDAKRYWALRPAVDVNTKIVPLTARATG